MIRSLAIDIMDFIMGRHETRIIKAADTIRNNKKNGATGACSYEPDKAVQNDKEEQSCPTLTKSRSS